MYTRILSNSKISDHAFHVSDISQPSKLSFIRETFSNFENKSAVRKKQPLASRDVARDASRVTSSERRKRTLRQKMTNILTHILRKKL